jgi:hypothetical protein
MTPPLALLLEEAQAPSPRTRLAVSHIEELLTRNDASIRRQSALRTARLSIISSRRLADSLRGSKAREHALLFILIESGIPLPCEDCGTVGPHKRITSARGGGYGVLCQRCEAEQFGH